MRRPTHRRSTSPAEMLVEEFGLSPEESAAYVPITPESAQRLADRLGTSPEFWLALQELHG